MLRSARRASWVVGLTLAVSACAAAPEGPGNTGGSTSGPDPQGTATTTGEAATTTPADSTGGPPGGTTEAGPATFGDGSATPEFCPPGIEPALELGLGDESFRPPDSGPAQIIFGHQGGYHVVVGLRAVGLDLADWGEGYLVATIDETIIADHPTVAVMQCADDGQYSEALWINLILAVDPTPLLGQVATVEAQYTDASNQVVTATAEITLSDAIDRG